MSSRRFKTVGWILLVLALTIFLLYLVRLVILLIRSESIAGRRLEACPVRLSASLLWESAMASIVPDDCGSGETQSLEIRSSALAQDLPFGSFPHSPPP